VKRGMSGILGATVGFVAAAAAILPLALMWAGTGASGEGETITKPRAYVKQILTIASAQFFTNALMQVDITILGRFLSIKAATPEIADEWVGVYRACQLFAFLPYQLLFSVTQVLFPMLARANADGDNAAVKRFVLRGSRIGAVICGLLVSMVVALPQSLLGFARAGGLRDGRHRADHPDQPGARGAGRAHHRRRRRRGGRHLLGARAHGGLR
jgi:stage V sporulation protein B